MGVISWLAAAVRGWHELPLLQSHNLIGLKLYGFWSQSPAARRALLPEEQVGTAPKRKSLACSNKTRMECSGSNNLSAVAPICGRQAYGPRESAPPGAAIAWR